jgi:hypothetical protein
VIVDAFSLIGGVLAEAIGADGAQGRVVIDKINPNW